MHELTTVMLSADAEVDPKSTILLVAESCGTPFGVWMVKIPGTYVIV